MQAYTKALIDVAVKHRLDDLWAWYTSGLDEVIASFGNSSHTKDLLSNFVKFVREEGGHQGEATEFRVEMPMLADWEMGIEGPELVVLRNECLGRSSPFPKSELIEPLFTTNTTLRHDHGVGLETDRALELRKKTIHNFTIALHPNGKSSILLVSIPHPQTCMIQAQDSSHSHHLDHSLNLLKALHDGHLNEPRNLQFP